MKPDGFHDVSSATTTRNRRKVMMRCIICIHSRTLFFILLGRSVESTEDTDGGLAAGGIEKVVD